MFLKTIFAIMSHILTSLPGKVGLILVIFFQSVYIVIDYFIIDLTPSVGTYYHNNLSQIEEKIDRVMEECYRAPYLHYPITTDDKPTDD